jgi:hypothetical protein
LARNRRRLSKGYEPALKASVSVVSDRTGVYVGVGRVVLALLAYGRTQRATHTHNQKRTLSHSFSLAHLLGARRRQASAWELPAICHLPVMI